jgi:HD-GYP domain-containing protein (c-di-GMP phosphodiesterase class II)
MGELLGGVRHHHERWDGSGYPVGLEAEAIPELGRLVAVVDAFDAMRSARSYREGRNSETVRAEIEKCAGTHFDPEMAKAFLKIDLTHYDEMLARTQKSTQSPDSAL